MNPIRILHVTRTLDPAEGLLPLTAVRIASEQAEAGHHVTLLTMDCTGVMVSAQRAYGQHPGYARIHLYHSHDRGSWSYLFGNTAIQWMLPIAPQLSVIHLHGMWEALLRRAAMIGTRHAVPVVVTPHPLRAPPAPRCTHALLALAMRFKWVSLLRQAAMVHALDEEEDRRLREMGLRDNIYHVPDGRELAERVTHSYPIGGKLPKAVACALAARPA